MTLRSLAVSMEAAGIEPAAGFDYGLEVDRFGIAIQPQ